MSNNSVFLGSDKWNGIVEYKYIQCYLEDQNFVIVLKQDENAWTYLMFDRAFFVHFWNKLINAAQNKTEEFFDDIYGRTPKEEDENERKYRCRLVSKLKDATSYYVIKFINIRGHDASVRISFSQIGTEQDKKIVHDSFQQYIAQANDPETVIGGTISTIKKSEEKQILRARREGELISPESLIAHDITTNGEIKFNLNKAILKILGYDILTLELDFVYKEFGDSLKSITWNIEFPNQILQSIGSQLVDKKNYNM